MIKKTAFILLHMISVGVLEGRAKRGVSPLTEASLLLNKI